MSGSGHQGNPLGSGRHGSLSGLGLYDQGPFRFFGSGRQGGPLGSGRRGGLLGSGLALGIRVGTALGFLGSGHQGGFQGLVTGAVFEGLPSGLASRLRTL